MTKLLKKEFQLAMHPTVLIFLGLSAMLLIPNYPYLVVFFYMALAVFFTCLSGRENKDIYYTMLLPVRKRDVVRSRFAFVAIMELLQLITAVPFAILRQSMSLPGNQVGMDANIAFFGLSLLMLGLFNLTFFGVYYKDVNQVGKAFLVSSAVMFLYLTAVETCAHAVPFFRDRLDTSDPAFLAEKLLVLAAGALLYILLTAVSYRRSVRSFEALDL